MPFPETRFTDGLNGQRGERLTVEVNGLTSNHDVHYADRENPDDSLFGVSAPEVSQSRENDMGATIVLDDQVTFVTDPVSPCAGEEFTVSWQEKNIGDEDSAEYQDIFDLDDQGSGDSQELQCDSLPAGEAAMRSLTFTLPAGDYVMTLVINGQVPLTLGNVIINECS